MFIKQKQYNATASKAKVCCTIHARYIIKQRLANSRTNIHPQQIL